jgi:hypothetical protein
MPGKETIKEAIKESFQEIGSQTGSRTSLTIPTGTFYYISAGELVVVPTEVYAKGEIYILGELLIV